MLQLLQTVVPYKDDRLQSQPCFCLTYWCFTDESLLCFVYAAICNEELLEGEELDHRIRSRINLVDLAGSERCSATGTIGERLKVTHPLMLGSSGLGCVFRRLQAQHT